MAGKICIDKGCAHSIVTRDEWGAEPPRPTVEKQAYSTTDPGVALVKLQKRIVVHHSAWRPTDKVTIMQERAFRKGDDDIAYHFYIMDDGSIYEGRALKYVGGHAGMTVEANAAHDIKLDPDYGSIGIAVAGCFDIECKERHQPTAAQKAALFSLIIYLRSKLQGIGAGDIVGHKEILEKVILKAGLHPDDPKTRCPGAIMSWVEEIVKQMEAGEKKAK